MELLERLFGSKARLKTLRLFLFNRDTAFLPTEISRRTKLPKEIVRRELVELLASGLIRKKGAQPPIRYQTNPNLEYLNALDAFIRETTNIHPLHLTKALKRAGTLRLVALSGLFTGALEPQIDLLVVGDSLDERALSRTIRALEAELGREIRYASFTAADFRYRMGVYDRLLRDVFDYPHRVLIDKIGL